MYTINDVSIVIPAYNPDAKFISFLKELKDSGYNDIIVVNDGSKKETLHLFREEKEEYGCTLITHSINLGQGRAYKTAFNYYLSKEHTEYLKRHNKKSVGIIQCDCDGQHIIHDIDRCYRLLCDNPDKFILGVRSFSNKSIPFRSRFGNILTSFVFKYFCGLDIKDTQTGLKGIPNYLVPSLMEVYGERFEYASSVLLEIKNQRVDIIQFSIETIYINENETSHFNPIIDSIRIYSLIFKYLFSSLSTFLVDIVCFSIFALVSSSLFSSYIMVSTYLAKAISCTYSFSVNKKYVFKCRGNTRETLLRFLILSILQATISGVIINYLYGFIPLNLTLVKTIVDVILFFISFHVQNKWVFVRK